MSTIKRGAFNDMNEQGDTLSHSGAPTLRQLARTCDDHPCPTMSCACTGATRPSLQPTAPAPEQIRKVQKLSVPSENEQDMETKEVDIVRTSHTVRYPCISSRLTPPRTYILPHLKYYYVLYTRQT